MLELSFHVGSFVAGFGLGVVCLFLVSLYLAHKGY